MKTVSEYGYNSLSPFESNGFCAHQMAMSSNSNLNSIGVQITLFHFILPGSYDSFIQIPVNTLNKALRISYLLHINRTENSSAISIHLDPNLSLLQITYVKVNQNILTQITFLKSSPEPLYRPNLIAFLPLDIPKTLLNYYILFSFATNIAILTPISFENFEDIFIMNATYSN